MASGQPLVVVTKPLSTLFRWQAENGVMLTSVEKSSWRASVPVIVVGNISVGGVGKTPLVAWLMQILQEAGYKPVLSVVVMAAGHRDIPLMSAPIQM
ncbi:MAG: tetraacyldisaccharide 4'-kinase [Pseudomonadales bacterium]